ncbi:ovarian-specific serine/threonine-protein kinase Lok [Condylostylus longicornis]|uniref:ovarian-specific serine/threonine-protein kinase Lok n=1 Tax=Condylostylus longicornis TaxID=2530218 RepID=UPI00244E12F0|nr:ovarian-specific serine/threonine-protein kinase Lok [Condylostylus longicornis]
MQAVKDENISSQAAVGGIGETQTQASYVWSQIESQPIHVVWGQLYSKKAKIKNLDLCKEKFCVGRAETNDLVLKEDDIEHKHLCRMSKEHFSISRNLPAGLNPVYIQDLSRNGTFVNGERIGMNKRRILKHDDIIALSYFKYQVFVFKDLSPNESNGLPKEICDKYYIGKNLGSGACGTVRLVYDVRTCDEYAMKIVQKNPLAESTRSCNLNDPNRVLNEVKIMKSLEHPCVVKMHDIVDKADSVYMVLEYMKGGDLLTRIIKNKRLSEKISKLFFYQMCHAVRYLHENGITHRDLKPDNILLETDDEETLLKISDFGLSKNVRKNSELRTLCGTPLYVAPEILLTGGRGSYTEKVDIWSLGVVLFTMLSGTLPFSDDYGTPATEQIRRGDFKFNHPSWKNVSSTAKKFIIEMLTVDPFRRPSINYVLTHRWLKDPDIIRKSCKLMNLNNLMSDDENFLEPPAKRQRILRDPKRI